MSRNPNREFRCVNCRQVTWQPVTDDDLIREARLREPRLRQWFCGCRVNGETMKPKEE